MKTITKQQALNLILKSHGKYFTVRFQKRTSDEIRTLTGRIGVRKGVKGTGLAFNPKDKGLVVVSETVWLRNAKGKVITDSVQFRTIPAEGIEWLKIQGKEYDVV